MNKVYFSIICSTFGNPDQVKKFINQICHQEYKGKFELIVADHQANNSIVCSACCGWPAIINIRYYEIKSTENGHGKISTGINKAAQKAYGRYLIIVNDINTTFKTDLLYKISKIIKQDSLILPTESIACLSRLNFYKYGQFPDAKNSWNNYLKKLSKNLNILSLS